MTKEHIKILVLLTKNNYVCIGLIEFSCRACRDCVISAYGKPCGIQKEASVKKLLSGISEQELLEALL